MTELLAPELAPFSPQSGFVKANGVNLHYVACGFGPEIVFLHGWPETWLSWSHVMAKLAPNYRVIAPDLRGTGASERTPTGYDKRTLATDIKDFIIRVCKGPVHVVAHDMGGKAAYVMAKLYPDIFRTLILVDCLVPGTENINALPGGAWHYAFHMAPEFPEMLTAGKEAEYITAQIRSWSHRKHAIPSSRIADFAEHYRRPGGMTAGFALYRTLREDGPFVETIRGIPFATPVMTITGQYGVGDKLAAQIRDEASDLTSVVVKDSGHFVAEEATDEFCENLTRFLAKHAT